MKLFTTQTNRAVVPQEQWKKVTCKKKPNSRFPTAHNIPTSNFISASFLDRAETIS